MIALLTQSDAEVEGETVKVGYARVSTEEQNEGRQIRAFEEMGIERVFVDKASGKNRERPQLQEMLTYIREGDIVTVESISRAARNTKDLLHIVEKISARGAEFVSLKEQIDTTTPTGKFMLTVFAAMAELERETILERQREGIAIAKEEGKYKGKPRLSFDQEAMRQECKRWRDGEQTAVQTMGKLAMKPNTFYRRVKEMGL